MGGSTMPLMTDDNDKPPRDRRPLTFETAPRWLRANEAARLARVSTRTMRRWVSLGLVRASRPAGGRVLIDRDALHAFIDNAAA